MLNAPTVVGTALTILAALALLWASVQSNRTIRDGLKAAERDRESIRSDVQVAQSAMQNGLAAAAQDRESIRPEMRDWFDAAARDRQTIRSEKLLSARKKKLMRG